MPYRGKKRKKTRTQKPEEEKEKMPQSIVARKGSVGPYVADLVKNIRNIMAPNTAMHLNEKTSNSVKDYVNIAGPYGVTHIILVSKGKMVPRMRIGCFPQGPTLHFRVEEYSLSRDILKIHGKGIDTTTPFFNSPVLVLNNFPEDNKPLKLVTTTFQGMFPAINPETIHLNDCRRVLLLHYDKTSDSIFLRQFSIERSVVGVSEAVSSILKKKAVPNLSNLKDISEFIMSQPAQEEYEFDDDSTVSGASLTSTSTTGGAGKAKQSVKLVELGPRMRLTLMLVETGLFQGDFIFNKQTKDEEKDVMNQRRREKKIEKQEVIEAKKEEEKTAELEKKYKEVLREENRQREKTKREKRERQAQHEKETKEKAAAHKEKAKAKGKVFHKKSDK
ncbi:SWI4 1, Peter Pan-like protein suppressor [Blastocystis sp. ATCC 50177/Nand II]|uniref:SWI4 1, Peter Pan-like protein suppressor n=1 Tax=Blastocystis sp. subtype 1 (strain ATCC 50177 / NandII) TaxID=478820 RepID=A0A196SJQ8_BLAHN|nr:SWI4 1, Peter Pan-like protein suppressor [Blastocystis sp. ATCC 50177/Nand II]